MSFRKQVRKNVPKVDFQAYNVLIAGGFKTGKTRAWKELMELHYPEDPEAGLLMAWEDGYQTWELESIIDMNEDYDPKKYKSIDKEAAPWEFFRKEVVPDLVEEAKNGRVSKVIGMDTVDRMIDAAGEWIIYKWNKKYGTNYTSIQEFNENIKEDNVWIALRSEIWKQIDKLKNAGYGMIWLAWTKEKETTTIDGLKFNSIELAMSNTGKKIFHSKAHLVCCLHNDVIVTDKDGNALEENEKGRRGKEVASNFHTTEVNMYFRPSNYIDIAGGRFKSLPEKVPYSAENFMEVFKNAVKGQLKKTNDSVEELSKQQSEEREEKSKEYAEHEEQKDSLKELLQQVDDEVQRIRNEKKTGEIKDLFTELFGKPTGYKTSNDQEKLKQALEHAKKV